MINESSSKIIVLDVFDNAIRIKLNISLKEPRNNAYVNFLDTHTQAAASNQKHLELYPEVQ